MNNTSRHNEPMSGVSLGDIYFIIFRHKWIIAICSMLGILAAGAAYFLKPPPFQSQAELLIKYVPEAKSLTFVGDNQKVLVPDSRGQDIINSEIQILLSYDLAEQAATNMGASTILSMAGGGDNPAKAAGLIRNNLEAAPAEKGSSVIVVTLKHPDPKVVQPLLQEVISDYFRKHYEIHSAVGQFDDALSRERATLSFQLNETEQQLASLKNKANVLSLDDSKKGIAEQITKIQGAILDAQAELAGYEAAMKNTGTPPPPETNEVAAAEPAVPADQLDAYNDLCSRLDFLRKKEQDYLSQGFKKNNVLLKEVTALIAEIKKDKVEMEKKYPRIASMGTTAAEPANSTMASAMDIKFQINQTAILRAKIKAWNAQLDQLLTQTTNLNNMAPVIAQLEQTKAIQLANLENMSLSLEKSHIDEALDTGKAPNIKWVQMPSPPFRDWQKTYKRLAILAFGGILAGLAWAFLFELYLDRSIKRPVDIQSKLKIPLFLAIPDLNRNGNGHLAMTERRQIEFKSAIGVESDAAPIGGDGAIQVTTPWVINPALRSYYDALRDRLVVYFESINLTRKPKLVAVTSTDRGSGVSTIAAGLAASLSETGDGRVLLVDMNVEQGSMQQFFGGKPGCKLDDALESDRRENALVQNNLYVVSENSISERLPRILPKRFASLVPRLKASDYDYIIFDMPPVSPTSVTSRLAGFMDNVMLVVESEKTDREVVQQANALLAQSKANVTAVLNKTRKYIPTLLHRDFNSDF